MSHTRRAFLYQVLGACMASKATALQRRAPAVARRNPEPFIGYGLVNLWYTIDAARLAARLHAAGCNFTEIEYVAWFNEAARRGESAETRVRAAQRLVKAMRRRNITTMISLVNWNGSAQRKQDDAWFLERLREIRSVIGPDRVILLPVSEPDGQEGGKAYRWAEMATREWPGLRAGNGDVGRGDPRVPGFDYVDWHHCDDFTEKTLRLTTAGKPTLNNTDCGPVLNPGPTRAAAMARIALARGAHFGVYGFKDSSIDETVIRALGEEICRRREAKTTPASMPHS
ncbi:MAG TPA: hypothetical protein VGN26_18170 [Armatimonadota bacterium]|jgi:hypothetical protein